MLVDPFKESGHPGVDTYIKYTNKRGINTSGNYVHLEIYYCEPASFFERSEKKRRVGGASNPVAWKF